jgi:hypothetical protein
MKPSRWAWMAFLTIASRAASGVSSVKAGFVPGSGEVQGTARQGTREGRFHTSGHYGEKRLGFDSDAEVELHGR